jgi:hypothetical protein
MGEKFLAQMAANETGAAGQQVGLRHGSARSAGGMVCAK